MLHARRVAAGTRITVPIPGTADAGAALENPRREADLPQFAQHVHADEAGAGHDCVDIAAVVRGVLGLGHCSRLNAQRSARRYDILRFEYIIRDPSLHLDDRLDLDGDAERHDCCTNRDAGMRTVLAKNRQEQLRGAVDQRGNLGDVGRAVGEALDLGDLLDAIEIAMQRDNCLSEGVQRTKPVCFADLFNGKIMSGSGWRALVSRL